MIKKKYACLPPVLQQVLDHGYVVFNDGDYDLNIIGLRNVSNPIPNEFDDRLIVAYTINGEWYTEQATITTDAGRYWLQKADYKPCAVYKHPQQARGAYKIGLHRGKIGLRQIQKVQFWRDGDKDEHANYGGHVYKDLIGLNIHRSSEREGGAKYVDRWSAGCQVFKYIDEFNRFIELCKLQELSLNYHTFTYTLLADGE